MKNKKLTPEQKLLLFILIEKATEQGIMKVINDMVNFFTGVNYLRKYAIYSKDISIQNKIGNLLIKTSAEFDRENWKFGWGDDFFNFYFLWDEIKASSKNYTITLIFLKNEKDFALIKSASGDMSLDFIRNLFNNSPVLACGYEKGIISYFIAIFKSILI